MSKIVWLASYPKSGNTWVRILLNNYVLGGDAPTDINALEEGLHAASRVLFDRLTGVESSDLTVEEINGVRPTMYRQWAADSEKSLFVKVHDAWHCNAQGEGLFPREATALAVYIVRNPLDVVSSFANHYGLSRDEAIERMNNSEHALASSQHRLLRQLHQFLGAWHEHAHSWLQESGLPLHIMRYEDMVHGPRETFSALLRALGLPYDEQRLEKAIEFSSFKRLKAYESKRRFKERLAVSGPFFRRGEAGGWVEELTPAQIARVQENHGTMMRHFGYL